MATNKTGFDYYNTDTDRYQDIKIKRLKKEKGCTGIAIYDYILCEIYRVKGYYLYWDENMAFDIAEYFSIDEDTINDVLNYCFYVGLFDLKIFNKESVITSASIQFRFQEMSSRAKRKIQIVPDKYRIITEECSIITEECSRVEESRVKESKEYNIANQRLACDNSLSPAAVSDEKLKKDSQEKSETKTPPPSREKDVEVDYKKVIELYHENCDSFPRVFKLSDARKAKIRIRLEEMKNDYSILETIFKKMGDSKFLKGDNKNGWKASFDWVFENERNWVKIIEGNYDNKQPHNGPAINPVNHPSATFKNDKKYEQF